MTIYARKGERITCESCHHEIGVFNRDVTVGETTMVDMATWTGIPVPDVLDRIGSCPSCGAMWGTGDKATIFHIDDRWRKVADGRVSPRYDA